MSRTLKPCSGFPKKYLAMITRKKTSAPENLDPLYVIFEQHLHTFEDADSDRKTFITQIVAEYMAYLRKMKFAIPREYEHLIVDELAAQVNVMLVKKIYGCTSIEEYRRGLSEEARGTSDKKYSTLIKRRAG